MQAQVKFPHPCVSGRIDHLIQIKDAPSARGREELLGECKIAPAGCSRQHRELLCAVLLCVFVLSADSQQVKPLYWRRCTTEAFLHKIVKKKSNIQFYLYFK